MASNGLLPGFEQIYGNTGRSTPYRLQSVPWKIILHTVEGRSSTLNGWRSVARNHSNGPHAWVDPLSGRRWRLQTVPLNMSAKALAHPSGTMETNHARAAQVEIAGFASQTQTWERDDLEWLGSDVVAPMVRVIRELGGNIDLKVVERTYGANEGIILASVHSPIRYAQSYWVNTLNWVSTHQRAHSNSHWDAGRLDLAVILAAAREELNETPAPVPVPVPDPEEITVSQAADILKAIADLKAYVDTKTLGLMSFIMENQKTGILWRVEGTTAPWYGRDGDGTYMLDFETAVQFKALHEIKTNSPVISQVLHDAITSVGPIVNATDRSAEDIVTSISTTDAEYLNGPEHRAEG